MMPSIINNNDRSNNYSIKKIDTLIKEKIISDKNNLANAPYFI